MYRMRKIPQENFTYSIKERLDGISGKRIKLVDDWRLQSSEKITNSAEDMCRPDFSVSKWHRVSIPSTVMGSLIKNGIIKDPYFGLNLYHISEKPFKVSWWYRKQFFLKNQDLAHATILQFDGINYSANIWINRKKIADSTEVEGAFRQFKFDITELINEGENVLLVEVFPPQPGDFSIGFVDWNPAPPDKNMGIFRDVRLHFCENVSIDYPFVKTHLDSDILDIAELTISAESFIKTFQISSGVALFLFPIPNR